MMLTVFSAQAHRRRAGLAAATLATLIALAAAGPVHGATPCRTVTLTGAANGHTVSVPRCGRLVIRLKEAFDGGYAWRVSQKPAAGVLRLVSSRAVSPKRPPGLVGGYDTRVLTYRATGAGRTSLRLIEARSGDSAHPVARYRLQIRVA